MISSKDFFKYLLELLIVAFGVFLGIYVSEYRSDIKTQQEVTRTVNYLIDELESNKKSIDLSSDYLEMIRPNYQKLRSSLTKQTINGPYFPTRDFHITMIEGWTGVGLPKYKTISYESAALSGIISDIDLDKVRMLSGIYKGIEFNEEFGKSVLDKFLEIDTKVTVRDVMANLELLLSDVVNSQKYLSEELELVITELKNNQ